MLYGQHGRHDQVSSKPSKFIKRKSFAKHDFFILIRIAHFPLIVKGELAIVSITHKTKLKHTKLSVGKAQELSRGKQLTNDQLWPMTLIAIVNGVQLKLKMELQRQKDFVLYVNEEEYFTLKYKAQVNAMNQDGESTALTGTIKLNDIEINNGPLLPTFTAEYVKSIIELNIKDDDVEKIQIGN